MITGLKERYMCLLHPHQRSKRQTRYDDLNDEDYAPNQSDLAAESSAAEDSDEPMEGAHGSDDDEVIDVQSMNQPGRR